MFSHGRMLVVLLALFAFTTTLIFGPGCTGKGEKKIRIGFLVKNPEEPWFQDEWRFAQKCADKYGFELIKIRATDGEKVLSAIDNLGTQRAQGFVICTPDVRLGPAIMARAKSNRMKVFAVDDQFVGADGNFMDVHYMGISARSIGNMVGKALAEEFKKRNWDINETAVAAITFQELNTLKERTDGAESALVASGFPPEKIFHSAEQTTDVPGSFTATNTLLTQHPEVKRWLVFSVNDEGVLGAVRAMENRGFNSDTIIGIGIGGVTALPEFEKETPTGFFATCLLSPYRHGYETAERLYTWIRDGIEPPKDTRTEGIMIDRTNFRRILAEQDLLGEAGADSTGSDSAESSPGR